MNPIAQQSQYASTLRGLCIMALLTINALTLPGLIVCGWLLICLLPNPWYTKALKITEALQSQWTKNNRWIFKTFLHTTFDIQGEINVLDRQKWYLLICNHLSWTDVILIQTMLVDILPPIKFFLKQQLIWLPVIGWTCRILNFPFMQRYTISQIKKKPAKRFENIHNIQYACQRIAKRPATLVNFAEGTRFTSEKHKKKPTYDHLLIPQIAGPSLSLQALHPAVNTIIDATLIYRQRAKAISLWRFCCGYVDHVRLDVALVDVDETLIGNCYEDKNFKRHFSAWLNQRWKRKDALIANDLSATSNHEYHQKGS